MKKRNFVFVIILLGLLVSIPVLLHYTTTSFHLSGTYSAGNEPDKSNIYVVLKDGQFTIYNQEEILENGMLEKVDLYKKSHIYKLVSEENTKVGYIVHNKNSITLLDFKSMDFSLKKISTNAIYLNYDSE